jgi:hypothetical protein
MNSSSILSHFYTYIFKLTTTIVFCLLVRYISFVFLLETPAFIIIILLVTAQIGTFIIHTFIHQELKRSASFEETIFNLYQLKKIVSCIETIIPVFIVNTITFYVSQ